VIPGLSGSLFSHEAIEHLLRTPGSPLELPPPAARAAHRELRRSHAASRERLGPSAGARTVFDIVADPLARALGFGIVPVAATSETTTSLLQADGMTVAVMVATAWGQSAGTAWRHAVHAGIARGVRWALCVTGPAVRLFDVDRAYARRSAGFDLEAVMESEEAFRVLWGALGAAAMKAESTGVRLDRLVRLCESHRADVRVSLRDGVHHALVGLAGAFRAVASKRHADEQVMHESLVVIYRILFLLFAEARGLVPAWHPVYRDGYTIERLRRLLDRADGCCGVWESLQAIARLAHRGCRAGELRVPPFNGRLFSPADAPLADTLPLDDRLVAGALLALTTRPTPAGPASITYADLGVEQLGGVYEHLLDYDIRTGDRQAPAVLVATGRRKATGSFYTPRSLTDFLVRRTLAPVVHDRTPDQILALRVLDPAMGSGAFLVAACRYLAAAYENALVREGALGPDDVDDADRAGFRRTVVQRCLFGVDVNPMAVQLGRLSLWLATLAAERPLTFLDHHLRVGNSLVGASIDDIMRRPPGGRAQRRQALPLFDVEPLTLSLESAVGARTALAFTPDDTLEQVRRKEQTLGAVNGAAAPLDRWRAAADLWCAAWYDRESVGRGVFLELLQHLLQGTTALPARVADPMVRRARELARRHRFFHWTLEFPEVFYDADGRRLPAPGFDAVIGNPPWEVIRQSGMADGRDALQDFVRESGLYTRQGRGHPNLYQLFVERAFRLLRPGGRAGLILPSSFASDSAGSSLRRLLIDQTSLDTFATLDNRDGIFPIHRSLKFLLLTCTTGGTTAALPMTGPLRSADALDRMPDAGPGPRAVPITRALVEQLSGESLAVPDIRSAADVEILSHVAQRIPALADPDGWGLHFGRELNASDDRPYFREDGQGVPVLEGKQIQPFVVDVAAARYWIPANVVRRLPAAKNTFGRARLAYRDVASAANRTTLIAAILPPNVVSTHTLFCVREMLDERCQHFLCGIFNSFVANYLVRMWVSTHVTTAIMSRLRVPRPPDDSALFRNVARFSRALSRTAGRSDVAPRLNAAAARLYELSAPQVAHVLDTFPLVPDAEREAVLKAFVDRDDLRTGSDPG
jgi:hypothetical protein